MTEKSDIQELREQLIELQTQVAFQEEAISSLNQALTQQQQDLSALLRHSELLREQYAQLQASSAGVAPESASQERPPHY